MLRVNRVINWARASIPNCQYLLSHDPKISPSHPQHFASKSSIRFFDIYKLASKEQGSADELNRGYFDDMSELKQHGGKMNKFTVLRDLNFVAKNLGVEFFKGTLVV
ncbi:hypothetical protein ERO13_A01G109901v2 [Gossypium hirsutum]|nr:hypothetical protein ERO13_A01G109901v2 [Gossypium hirsutum]